MSGSENNELKNPILNETYEDSYCINNTCQTDLPGLYRHDLPTVVILCCGYILVFVLGLIGNSFVVAVVIRAPRMRTVTNYFIANLAIADILVIVFCLPANLISNLYVPWMLGWFVCKSFTYVQTVSVSASVNSLVAVSFDRFLAIWFPLRPQITKRTARSLIVLIWILAGVIAIPMAIFFDLENYDAIPNWGFCVEVWPSDEAERFYFLTAHLLLCYLLPLKLISAFYIMIWIKVAHRSIPGDGHIRDSTARVMQQRSKVKVIKMLAVVVLIFMLSWLPLYVIFARIKLGGEMTEMEFNVLPIVTPIAQWLGSSNSCINPILYAFFNQKFRNGFLAILRSRTCCGYLRNDYWESTRRRQCSFSPNNVSSTMQQEESVRSRRGVVYSISGKSTSFKRKNNSESQSFSSSNNHSVRKEEYNGTSKYSTVPQIRVNSSVDKRKCLKSQLIGNIEVIEVKESTSNALRSSTHSSSSETTVV